MIIKLGICVAYDWELLKYSLPVVYDKVEKICLSIDRDQLSWNGNKFDIDREAFFKLVQYIDRNKKIEILEESFYKPHQTPIQNECYQRQLMANYLGEADWLMQIDTDEILLDFNALLSVFTRHSKAGRPVNIHGVWVNLIKQVEGGFVYSIQRTPPIATNKPLYEYGRTSGHFNIYENIFLAHVTWARPEPEVAFKLNNWGHTKECNPLSFFKIWQAIDNKNWVYLKNFHPMIAPDVRELHFVPAESLENLMTYNFFQKHRLKGRYFENNIWASRFRKLLRF